MVVSRPRLTINFGICQVFGIQNNYIAPPPLTAVAIRSNKTTMILLNKNKNTLLVHCWLLFPLCACVRASVCLLLFFIGFVI